jgi:hypothetical protein
MVTVVDEDCSIADFRAHAAAINGIINVHLEAERGGQAIIPERDEDFLQAFNVPFGQYLGVDGSVKLANAFFGADVPANSSFGADNPNISHAFYNQGEFTAEAGTAFGVTQNDLSRQAQVDLGLVEEAAAGTEP